jgi:hypothetical protein
MDTREAQQVSVIGYDDIPQAICRSNNNQATPNSFCTSHGRILETADKKSGIRAKKQNHRCHTRYARIGMMRIQLNQPIARVITL